MNTRIFRVLGVAAAFFCQATALAKEADMTGAPPTVVGRITGLGGVFFKSKDPKALAAWYHDVMGIKVEVWGGAKLSYDAPGHPPVAVWAPFPEDTDQMQPSTRDMMINFAVDDMDAFAARLTAKGVTVHRQPADPNGSFAWILDPDGTKIELWQPNKP
jgi:predicted enzyme related to lactoylglutathione lyase